jgi:hypothetical protein
VLGLLSEEADPRPVVCVVDDAQWLDRASAEALALLARRVLAESLGFVFAVREPSDSEELGGLPEFIVQGQWIRAPAEGLPWIVDTTSLAAGLAGAAQRLAAY